MQFGKLHSNTCGYLLIIRHLALIAKDFCITKHAHGEAVLFLPACYLEKKKNTLPGVLYCIRNSRMINICDCTWERGLCRAFFQNRVIATIGKSRL